MVGSNMGCSFSGNMVKLLVGPTQAIIQVHERVLSSSSRSFQRALKPVRNSVLRYILPSYTDFRLLGMA
jgi:hypothetical protein